MAAKRTASTELNHDNWDEEYEEEDAGTFKKASEDVIQQRVIKTARRRNPISENVESSTKNVFSNFEGFNKTNTSTPTSKVASPFAFLANLTKTTQSTSITNTNGLNSITSTATIFKMPEASTSNTSQIPINNKEQFGAKSSDYYAKLKGLNESVASWIKMHVDKNPFIILSPIFKDYEKYLKEIENSSSETSSPSTGFKMPVPSSNNSNSPLFSNNNKNSIENPFISSVKESEEVKDTNKRDSTASVTGFSFGNSSSNSSSTSFSFTSAKPFSFTNVSKPENDKKTDEPEEDEDEPPKVEFKAVVEEGHVFSKRCKVFVKKNDTFSDRGVGHLFLKPVEGSEKIQLIVRADTSLGNLLLNFILSSSIRMQRMGKNNVMMVCIPTPDSDPPPVPVLLRVKTSEEADELLKVLEKYKK